MHEILFKYFMIYIKNIYLVYYTFTLNIHFYRPPFTHFWHPGGPQFKIRRLVTPLSQLCLLMSNLTNSVI